jgi:molecular chaperone Hsp33
VAHYLLTSEQAPAAVGVGVWVEPDGSVGAAGGWMLQTLPGASESTITRLEANLGAGASPSELVRSGLDASAMLERLMVGLPMRTLDRRPVAFRCRCSRERVQGAMLAMGRSELADVLAGERRAEVVCEFCGERWVLEEDELRAVFAATTG